MRNITHTHTTAAALAAALALGVAAESAVARGGFGEDVDAFCQTYDGSTPFADLGGNVNNQGCLLCHTSTRGSGRVGSTWTWYLNRDYVNFCTGGPLNTPPVAGNDSATTDEDRALVIDVLANDLDTDGDTLRISAVSQGGNGRVTNNGSTVSYAPNSDFNGRDSFSYTISDGRGGSDTATVSMTVDPINDPPALAPPGDHSGLEGASVSVQILATDVDEQDALTYLAQGLPAGLGITSSGLIEGTLAPGSSTGSPYTVTVTVADNGAPQLSDSTTFTWRVSVSNSPPVITTSPVTAATVGRLYQYDVAATDANGDTLTFSLTTSPSGMGIDASSGRIEWIPAAGQTGDQSVVVQVTDSGGLTSRQAFGITVADAPVAQGCRDDDGDLFSPEGDICGPLDCDDLDPAVNPGVDENCGDGIDNDCDLAIDQSDSECNGSDCIAALLQDGAPLDLALRVSLEPGREPWVPLQDTLVSNDIYVFVASEPGILQVRYFLDGEAVQTENMAPWDFAGGSEAAANPLDTTALLDGQHVALAEIDLDDGTMKTTSANFTVENGPRLTIDFQAQWDAGERELSVEGTWRTLGAQVKVSNADTGALLGTTQVERDDGQLEWEFELERPASVPCRIRVEIEGEFGEADVVNAPADCDGGALNTSPRANDDSATTDEDTSVTLDVLANDADADNDPLSITGVSQGTQGSVQHDGNSVTYTPSANFFGNDSFTYSIVDGKGGADTATVSVSIRAVNDAPAAADDSAETAANQAVVIPVLHNDSDVDGDTLTVVSVTTPAGGTTSTDGNRVTYVPNPGFDGVDSFRYTVADGHGGTDTATVTVTVEAVSNPSLTIDFRAAWNARKRELSVEGTWRTAGVRVRVTNADTGALLGTTYVEREDGQYEWEFERKRPASVPCRIRVEIEGEFGEADVINAPVGCDDGSVQRLPSDDGDYSETNEEETDDSDSKSDRSGRRTWR